MEKNKMLYNQMEKLAQKYGCTIPQLALAWVLHQGDDVAPIPGETDIPLFIINMTCNADINS